MTDLFVPPASTNGRHPRFAVGDRIRPRPEWRDGQSPPIPSGAVKQVAAFGRGQVLRVGDDAAWYTAGTFEPDGDAA